MSFWKKDPAPVTFTGITLKADLRVHEANKAEAFQGMRAYHTSELNHKKDAISIFQTLITSVAIIYTGLIAGVYNNVIDDLTPITILGWVVFIVLVICSCIITNYSNKKISKDNARYNKYVAEYIWEREIIHLEEDLLNVGYKSYWADFKENLSEKPKTGYSYTKKIIIGLNIIVCLIGLTGAAILQIASTYTKHNAAKPTHVIVDTPIKIKQ